LAWRAPSAGHPASSACCRSAQSNDLERRSQLSRRLKSVGLGEKPAALVENGQRLAAAPGQLESVHQEQAGPGTQRLLAQELPKRADGLLGRAVRDERFGVRLPSDPPQLVETSACRRDGRRVRQFGERVAPPQADRLTEMSDGPVGPGRFDGGAALSEQPFEPPYVRVVGTEPEPVRAVRVLDPIGFVP